MALVREASKLSDICHIPLLNDLIRRVGAGRSEISGNSVSSSLDLFRFENDVICTLSASDEVGLK